MTAIHRGRVRIASAIVAALLLPGCTAPAEQAPADCREPQGDFLLVERGRQGWIESPEVRSGATFIDWTGRLYYLRMMTNTSSPAALQAPPEALLGVTEDEAIRALQVLGYGGHGETVVEEGIGADLALAWRESCELALRVWSLPDTDHNQGCADGGMTTLTATTSLGTRNVSFYCGGQTNEVRDFLFDWCEHVSNGLNKDLACWWYRS